MIARNVLMILLPVVLCSCGNGQTISGDASLFSTYKSQDSIAVNADQRGYIVRVGDMAPDFEIEFITGDKIKLSSLKGKVVMLQFTASWCSVCRKEMPYIETEIWQKNKNNKQFALFGIDYKESKEKVDSFAKSVKVTYPITLDINAQKFNLFCDSGAGVTRNIIIDKQGKIVMLTRLFDIKEFREMTHVIEKELNK